MSQIDDFLNDKAAGGEIDSFLAPKPSGVISRIADYGVSAMRGGVGAAEALVGIGNLATGGGAGKAVQDAGVDLKGAKDYWSEKYTPEQQAVNRTVQEADGFLPTLGAMLSKPSSIAHTAVESLPAMLTGGVFSRAARALAPAVNPITAGAAGEGVVIAGGSAEQVRQQTPDGTLAPGQAAAAGAAGVGGGIISRISGGLANRAGITDLETSMAAGKLGPVGAEVAKKGAQKGPIRKIAEGAAVEGFAEEMPQSAFEQAMQNVALDRPLGEGVGSAAAAGLLVGGAMGGPIAALNARQAAPAPAPADPTLQLGNTPDPLIAFPDGTIARRSEVEAMIATLPPEQQVAARARLAGMGPQPADPAPPVPLLALPAPVDYRVDSAGNVVAPGPVPPGAPPPAGPIETGAMGLGRNSEPVPAGSIGTPMERLLANQGVDPLQAEVAARNVRAAGFSEAELQREAELNAIQRAAAGENVTSEGRGERQRAMQRAGDMGGPTAMELAMQRARAAGVEPTAGPISRAAALAVGVQPAAATAGPAAPQNAPTAPQPAQTVPQDPASVPPAAPFAPQPGDIVVDEHFAGVHQAATSPMNARREPTDGQKRAENYKAGRTRVGRMAVAIENPQGSVRSGRDEDGNEWRTTMAAHYGRLPGTKAADSTATKKQQLDIFIKPGTPREFDGPVFVVDQVNPKTGKFDEHKVIAGPATIEEAEALYRSNYSADWNGLGGITAVPQPAFKAWAYDGKRKATPIGSLDRWQPAATADAPAASPGPAPAAVADPNGADGQPGSQPGDAQPADVGPVGRDAEPISQGGKPFKTKVGAQKFRKKYRPESRVVKVEGGFALRDATEKELEAGKKNGPRLQAALRSAERERNPLMAFIAEHGLFHREGARNSQKADFSPDADPVVRGFGRVFRADGLQLDELANRAAQDGFLPRDVLDGVDRTRELVGLIDRAIRGERIIPQYAEGAAEQELARRAEAEDDGDWLGPLDDEDLEAEGFDQADEALQDEVRALMAELQGAGVEYESVLEEVANSTQNGTQDDYLKAAKQALETLQAVQPGGEGNGRPPAGPGRDEAQAAAPAAEVGGDEALAAEAVRRGGAGDADGRTGAEAGNASEARRSGGDGAGDREGARDLPPPVSEGLTQERFEAGRALTKAQRKQVLGTLVDVYKAKGAPREQKGVGRDGNERYGYVHSPELFEKSDITGAMVRYHVTLPDGRRAHPSELFQDFTQAEIDKAMIEQEAAEKQDAASQLEVEQRADRHAADTTSQAEASFMRRNPGFDFTDWRTGRSRAFVHFEKGGKFFAVTDDDTAQIARLERAGWKRTDGLTAPTPEDILEQQRRREEGEKAEAKRKAAEQAKLKAEQERKDIAEASKAAAGTFELGGDALQNLSGQTDLLAEPPAAAPAPTGKIEDLGEKIGGARKDLAEPTGRAPRRQEDDRPAWARRFQVSQIVRAGGQLNAPPEEGRWVINDTRNLDWMKQPKQVGRTTFATKEEADAFVPIAAVGLKHRVTTASGDGFEIWRDVTDRKRVKVVDKTFATREEAMEYMVRHAVEIIETNTTFGEADLPAAPDRERIGPERRKGNVADTDFMETFGFRGVEFGNWNNQDERQQLMNDAFDGLLDLADVLGIPPKAISLNGDLALAFGARGHGLQSARAHYELEKVVINLTKEKGTGSLAHEWFHAADHYFSRQDGAASSKWKTDPDGTRSLEAKSTDFATHGFRVTSSGVREEVRKAYEAMLRTLFKKATTYVEDTQKADRFTAQTKDELAVQLDKLRKDLAEQKDPKYWKRSNKPASAEQLAEFDAIAARMIEGEAQALTTDWRTIPGAKARIAARWTNDSLEQLSALYKAVRGRTGFDSTNRSGIFDSLRGYMSRYSQRLKMLADAQSSTEKVKMVPTDFAMNAKELDQGRGGDYWTTPHEMAARAFQGYVEDKIAERGGVSRFLNYAPERAGIITPWGFKRPYPAGEERKAMNAAFDRLVGTLQTREEGGRTVLFSRSPRQLQEDRKFLDGPVVTTLKGDEFAPGSGPLSKRVAAWYSENGLSTVDVPSIGPVALDERAVKDSISHGLGRAKAAAFAAVPDVLLKGRIVHQEAMRGETSKGQAYFVAAPIRIGDVDMVVVVVVRADPNMQRMYVHEVAVREKLQQSAFETGASTAPGGGARTGAGAGAVRSVLQAIYDVKPSSQDPLAAMEAMRAATALRKAGLRRLKIVNAIEDVLAELKPDERKNLLSQSTSGARGMYVPSTDTTYLFRANLGSAEEAFMTGLHEAFHRGLRKSFGAEQIDPLLQAIYDGNARMRERADEYAQRLGIGQMEAIEEVLADFAGTGVAPELKGWDKLLEFLRELLTKIAAGLNIKITLTDQQVMQLVAGIRRAGMQDDVHVTPAADAPVRLSRKVIAGDTGRYTPAQLAAMRNVGFQVEEPTLAERAQALWKDAGKKLAQGIVDQFAPVKEISKDAYALLRLSKGASGAFEVFLRGGQLKLNAGAYDFDASKRGGVVERLLTPLQGEHHDFLRWVAANRAEQLSREDREHLFSAGDIVALKTLADGQLGFDYTLQHGPRAGQVTRDRTEAYRDSLRTFNEFNKNALDMAEQSGLIDGASRAIWEREFYVPFYRVEEEGGLRGMNVKSGAVRQQAFKKLKGGSQQLNTDLLENTLMNWAHLLDAAAKNRAATATLEAMAQMGAAVEAPESVARQMAKSIGKREGVVWFMDQGRQRFFLVDDPYLMTALTALEFAGLKGPMMTALGGFKHALTVGVTSSPFFKIRNLIRDSVQAIGTAPLSANIPGNLAAGWKATAPGSEKYFRLMAGGGTIHFGTMLEGSEAKRVQALVESGIDPANVLNSDSKLKAFTRRYLEPVLSAYNELGNRGEAVNRAALYQQLLAQGKSHAEASLMARDLLDFSMQGSFTAIRFFTQVVPFFNARIQGLYKLGRSAKEDPARFSAVLGAVTLLSLGLLAANHDDDDWKKREPWDRDNFWWFKVGGTAFRIPKPFEIGAIATLAERSAELMFDDEMTGKMFRERVLSLLSDSLSINPIPQAVKPILEVYANKNSFTERPIETMGMERMRPDFRFTERTSMAARALSTASTAAARSVGMEGYSPVQVDHLIRGYFGWLGSFVIGWGDMIARPATGQASRPEPDYWKAATGGMVAALEDAPSRYVSQMYRQAKELEQVHGTWRHMIQQGQVEAATAFRAEHAQELVRYQQVEAVKRAQARLNALQRQVETGGATPEEKRARLREIAGQKDRLARTLSPAV